MWLGLSFMAVQWLELPAFTAESPGSIPGQRTKITHNVWPKKKKKVKKKSYSLVYEQAGCFHLIGYCFWVEICFSFFLGTYLSVEFLGQMETPCLTFWGTARLFSKGGRTT